MRTRLLRRRSFPEGAAAADGEARAGAFPAGALPSISFLGAPARPSGGIAAVIEVSSVCANGFERR